MVATAIHTNMEKRVMQHLSESTRTQLKMLIQRITSQRYFPQLRLSIRKDYTEGPEETLSTIQQKRHKAATKYKQCNTKQTGLDTMVGDLAKFIAKINETKQNSAQQPTIDTQVTPHSNIETAVGNVQNKYPDSGLWSSSI